MLIIALGGEPPPTYGAPKMPIIKGTPAETILQGLVETARKKENWFNDEKQSAEMKRLQQMKAEAGKTEFSWPDEGWHKKLSREFTVSVGDEEEETYQVILTIDEGKLIKGKEEIRKLIRHATIAVKPRDGHGRYVDQIEAFTLTRFLGFKSAQPMVQMHPEMHALVFYEPIEEDEEKELRAQ